MRTKDRFFIVCGIFSLLSLHCGGGGGGTPASDEVPTISLTGQAVVTAADANLAFPLFKSVADTALTDATVTLFKMKADGTEEQVSIGTVTTDASGNYTIDDVPAVTAGTGATTDFYYEVRVAKGDVTIIAPAAPEEDTTVNVTPETHIAAKMLTDVQAVSGNVLPRPETVEAVRELTLDEISDDLASSITLPSVTDDDQMLVTATAIGSDNGNAEKSLRTFEAEKEALLLGTSTDTDMVGSYLERVSRLGCDFNENFSFPEAARDALATAFIDADTSTPTEIVAAFNDNNGSDANVEISSAVTAFDNLLENVDTAISDKTAIATADAAVLYTKRDLAAATFDASTALQADQSMAFLQGLFQQDCQPGSFDMIGFVSNLTDTDVVATPSIVDRQIFHDMGFGCTSIGGHLRAEIQVYAAGGATVNGVSLTKGSDTQSFQSSGTNGPFSRWTLSSSEQDGQDNAGFYCMAFPSDVTYTITVDLDGAADLTETVAANHREVPEASLSYVDPDGMVTTMSNDQGLYYVTEKRPYLQWDPAPGTPDESVIADAPEGSKIKFTFLWSYFLTDAAKTRVGYSGNQASLGQCGTAGSDRKYMDRNYFISNVDCDPAACLATLTAAGTAQVGSDMQAIAASNLTAADIMCHTNLQTFLVDANDRTIGHAAGNFRNYCYDSDDNGSCG